MRAKYVGFKYADGCYSSIDMPSALHPQTIVALDFLGKPLPLEFGFPMRLRIPTKHGFKKSLIMSMMGLLPAILYVGARGNGGAQDLAGLTVGLLTVHAVLLLGAIPTFALACICLMLTFAAENLSIATGIPFGHYRFLFGQDLVHIGAVPILIGPVYFVLCYQSWIIACLITNAASGETRDPVSLIFVPIVAAFTMTQWDLVADPLNATVDRNWIWSGGGGFLGVPLSNFLGWFLTTWTVFQLFQLFNHMHSRSIRLKRQGVLFLILPILIYIASGLSYLVPPFPTDREVTDGAGRVWSSSSIRTVAETLALFSLFPTPCFALIRLARQARDAPVQAVAGGLKASSGGSQIPPAS